MLKKFSSALLAVAISTMVSTTEAIKIQEDTGSHDPLEVTSAVFQISGKNEDDQLTKKEFNKAMDKLLKSDDVPGDKKFLKQVFKEADKADGKDDKVTYENALAAFTKALKKEAGEEAEEEAEEAEDAEEEVDPSE